MKRDEMIGFGQTCMCAHTAACLLLLAIACYCLLLLACLPRERSKRHGDFTYSLTTLTHTSSTGRVDTGSPRRFFLEFLFLLVICQLVASKQHPPRKSSYTLQTRCASGNFSTTGLGTTEVFVPLTAAGTEPKLPYSRYSVMTLMLDSQWTEKKGVWLCDTFQMTEKRKG
jgi:hypothetical protein